jgi:hypothetical protein
MLRTILAASIVGLAVIGATTAALPQDVTFNYAGTDFAVSKTSPVAISGTVDIEFGTRLEKSEDGTPNVGAVDTYKTDLTILDSVRLQGTIARKPWLPTGFTGNTKQDGFEQRLQDPDGKLCQDLAADPRPVQRRVRTGPRTLSLWSMLPLRLKLPEDLGGRETWACL